MGDQPEVRLRMLTAEDAPWLVELDREKTALARSRDWDPEKLAAELDEGVWATSENWGWGVTVDGEPAGYLLVTGLDTGDAVIELKLSARARGQGVGREALRQVADHHFAERPDLARMSGRTHEHNVPMQRAFNAAGFRMEARYRDSFVMADGTPASEWGYALTRADWEAGRPHADAYGYDLHGLTFVVEEVTGEGAHVVVGTLYKFLQEGRRLLARYRGGDITEGEFAGVLVRDLLTYRFVHDWDGPDGHQVVTGSGRSRLQRRQDNRLELVTEWVADDGRNGRQVLVERR